jgi:hypothetical protein
MQVTIGEIFAVSVVGLWFLGRLAGSLYNTWKYGDAARRRKAAGR